MRKFALTYLALEVGVVRPISVRKALQIKVTPIKATPIKVTPIKVTHIKVMPIKATPIKVTKAMTASLLSKLRLTSVLN